MIRTVALVAVLAAFAAADCGFPNGTDTKLNWWQGAGTGNVKFLDVQAIDAGGKNEYPISLKAPLTLKIHADNEQAVMSAGSLLMSIKLFEYGGFAGCSWSEIPTFGLLDNMDACKNGIPCPIQKGDQTISAVLDFTKFGSIIGLLKDDAPYQLQFTLTDKASNTYTNIFAQARTKTH